MDYLIWLYVVVSAAGWAVCLCPEYCTCRPFKGLRHTDCKSRQLINVQLDIPTTVESLDLSQNHISRLQDDCLKNEGLTKLQILNLSHNMVSSIELNAFRGLKKLRVVDLSYNHLNYILPGCMDQLPSLINLSLAFNPLRNIPDEQGVFLISSTLQDLDISGCRIGHLPKHAFSTLLSLTHLNISHNGLATLSRIIFAPLQKLVEIDISQNHMICDSVISEITYWLQMSEVVVHGSPCPSKTEIAMAKEREELSTTAKEEKSAKILQQPEIEEYFFSSREEDDEEERECACAPELPPPAVRECRGWGSLPLPLPFLLVLAFVGGVIAGGMFVIVAVAVKFRRPRCRFPYHTPQASPLTGSETPPPDYDDLFLDYSPPLPSRNNVRF